jgi:hypothetical protein
MVRVRENELIVKTYKAMFKDYAGKRFEHNSLGDFMKEIYKDGTLKEITAQLVAHGASSETALILMYVFDSVNN